MTTQELEIALQALAAQNVQLLERAERAEKKWAFVHEQYMAEREKRMAYEAQTVATALKPTHPEPKGKVPKLPKGVTIPDGAYQLGSEDILNRKTDWIWDGITWIKVNGYHEDEVSKLPLKLAYRIYK